METVSSTDTSLTSINSMNILQTDAPVVKLYTHMNKLYMFLEQNGQCYRGQDFDSISIIVRGYESLPSGIDLDKPIHTWSADFKQYQILTRQEMDGFPPYNIWTQLINCRYIIELHFNFLYSTNGAGSNSFASKINRIEFDNRFTTLTNTITSSFMTGKLRDDLEVQTGSNSFTVWFNSNPDLGRINSEAKTNDLVSNNTGTIIKQIQTDGTIDVAETNYLALIRYILNNSETGNIFLFNFGPGSPGSPGSPDDETFTFRLYLNKQSYYVTFRGNFKFLIKRATFNIRDKIEEVQSTQSTQST